MMKRILILQQKNWLRNTLSCIAFLAGGMLFGQTNIAPQATVTGSDCRTGLCSDINNLNFGTCGSQLMWISTSNPPSPTPGVDWIQWDFPGPVSFDELIIHHGNDDRRVLTGADIQYWDGSTWVHHHTFSGLGMNCINSAQFPRLTAQTFRITTFQMTGTGQTSNPNFREIEIIQASTSENDAGVSQIISPQAFCPGNEDVVVRVTNFGTNQIDSVYLDWTFNGTPQPGQWVSTLLDTFGGIGSPHTDVNLGSFTFAANTTYDIVAWTSMPNNVADTVNANDTLSVTVSPAISGTYTINDAQPTGGSNFNSFNDFANFLDANGVCGPVIANVVSNSGPYNEQVEFEDIVGVSSVNTITINGNGNTLQHSASGTGDRTTLTFNGAQYITVDSLKIEANGSSHGWVTHITGGSEHITIRKCSILASTTITSTTSAGIVTSGSNTSAITYGDNGSYLTIEDNYFEGGYYSVTLNGMGSNNNSPGNKVINNVMLDNRYYGIYARAQEDLEIIGNDISRPDRDNSTIFYAMTLRNGMANAKVMNNRIHNTHGNNTSTSTFYGIDIRTNTTSMGPNDQLVVANNLLYDLNARGLLYAIYMSNNNYVNVLHNTIQIDEPTLGVSGNTRMFYQTSNANDCQFKNNILYLNRGTSGTEHLVYVNTATSDIDIDNNVYHAESLNDPNVHLGYYSGNQSTFTAWQSANNSAYDQNGLEFNPAFIGGMGTDFLRPSAAPLNFLGANVQSLVPTDIEGFPRPAAPDPGAYQFEPPQGVDMAVMNFLSPAQSCGDSAEVVVEVVNLGTDTTETIWLEWEVNSTAQPPISVTDSFYAGNVVSVSLGWFPITPGQDYDIEVVIDSVSPGPDIDLANNSLELLGYRQGLSGTVTVNQLAVPSATNFSSFSELFDNLNNYGVCGPLIVDVVAGTGLYNEQVEAFAISGASSVNTITINGNGNTLSYSASGTGDRTTVSLMGASHITFDNLVIEANGATYGWVMHLTAGAEHITVKNCSIMASTTITGTFSAGIVSSGSNTSAITYGDNASYCTFENNYFEGGYYAITLNGIGSNNNSPGNKVLNNTMVDQRYYGMYLRAQEDIEVFGNDISRPNRDNSAILYALTARNGMPGGKIMNNRIHNTHGNLPTNTSTIYCMDFRTNSTSMNASNPLIVANNQIYDVQGQGLLYGIYTSNSQHTKFYHNTIVVDEPSVTGSGATRMFYTTSTATGQEFKNNIIYMERGNSGAQHMVWVNTATSAVEIDNNVYFAPDLSSSHVNFGRYSTDFADLTDWQTANNNAYDQNAVELDPTFIGGMVSDRYRPGAGAIKSIGANVQSLVPVDYDSVPRPTDPDPGAYEFTPLPCTGISDFTIDSLYPGGAVVSWVSPNITEWQVEWDSCGFQPGSQMGNLDPSVNTNQGYSLDSLPMGECICVFVREACPQGGYGPWSDPIEICVPIEDDAEMVSLISPDDMQCGDSIMDVIVEIRNNGYNPITSLPISVDFSGDIVDNITFTYTGNLLENEVDTVNVGSINSYDGGYVNVVASVNLPGDQLLTNDTVRIDSMLILPYAPKVEDAFICPGDDSVTFHAFDFPGGNYNWFDVPTGGSPIYTGSSLTTTSVGPPTVYVEYLDLEDSLETTFMAGNGQNGNMVDFEIKNTLNIYAFDMLPSSSSTTAGFEIYYKVGSYQGAETDATVWTLLESFTNRNVTIDVPHRLTLTTPIQLNANTTYSFYLTRTDASVRYTSTSNEYGIYASNADMDILEGVGKSYPFGSTFRPRMWNGKVIYGSEACSDERVEVTPTIADSLKLDFDWDTQSHTVNFTFTGSGQVGDVEWIFADTLGTALGDTVSFQFPETDSFQVCVVGTNGCVIDTFCQYVWAENIGLEDHGLAGSLRLFPNPSQGAFELSFNQPYISDVTIRLLDLNGKMLWTEHRNQHEGMYRQNFDRGDLAAGIYMLQIHNRDGMIVRRVVINK
ncbi:MAG: T9SS type A sorting domain-containing protein [Cryomorphaceae bacterium]|nr:T9SS type A sorting domain-containing protein [Cryomorphaceae bacterium]